MPITDLPPHIAEFLAYLQWEKRYSPHTVVSYQHDLTACFTYLATNMLFRSRKRWKPGLSGAGWPP